MELVILEEQAGGGCTSRWSDLHGTRYAGNANICIKGTYFQDQYEASDGAGNPGGLLVIYANDIKLGNNSKIEAKGTTASSSDATGGSSGGGSINIFYMDSFESPEINSVFNAKGGESINYSGKGADGKVSIGTIKNGNYVEKQ